MSIEQLLISQWRWVLIRHAYLQWCLCVLAGDTIRSAADLRVSMVAVTLLYRKGYFCQKLERTDGRGGACGMGRRGLSGRDAPANLGYLEGRTVHLRVWRYEVKGVSDFKVPVFFLDSDLPENSEWDRTLTISFMEEINIIVLSGSDHRDRWCTNSKGSWI